MPGVSDAARSRGASVFTSSIPYDEARIRAAAIYCSDGRYGDQMDEFLHRRLELPRYDRLAIPGGPACLSGRLGVFWEGRSVEQQLDFLCRVHALERLVLIAHESCAFYRDWLKVPAVDIETQQIDDLSRASVAARRVSRTLTVEAYLARRNGALVHFDPVVSEPRSPSGVFLPSRLPVFPPPPPAAAGLHDPDDEPERHPGGEAQPGGQRQAQHQAGADQPGQPRQPG
jgi:hypothetical protein